MVMVPAHVGLDRRPAVQRGGIRVCRQGRLAHAKAGGSEKLARGRPEHAGREGRVARPGLGR